MADWTLGCQLSMVPRNSGVVGMDSGDLWVIQLPRLLLMLLYP